MKKIVLFFLTSICLNAANAQEHIIRKADGSVSYMSLFQAMDACPNGTHIPNARELAEFFQSKGAKGILEIDPANPTLLPPGYALLNFRNRDGERDGFLFNFNGYQIPNKDYADYFWSTSSVRDSDVAYYLFDGVWGTVQRVHMSVNNVATLCLPIR